MPATRYFDRFTSPEPRQVTTSGQQPGPPGGDGWQVVETVPAGRMPSGAIAILVRGRVSNLDVYGTPPGTAATGMLQVCLGDSSNLRSPHHLWTHPVIQPLPAGEGLEFSFLIAIKGGIHDPTWGSAWSSATELQILARLFWNTDSINYGATWDVSDIEVTWALLDNIPSGEQLVWERATPLVMTVGGSVTNQGGFFGATDEVWLTWAAAYTTPGGGTVNGGGGWDSAGISWRVTDGAGGTVIVGTPDASTTSPEHGMQPWAASAIGGRRRPQFVMIPRQMPNSERHRHTWTNRSGQPMVVDYFVSVSIRVDLLPAMLFRGDAQLLDFTEYSTNILTTQRVAALEVGQQQLSWEPFVFASCELVQLPSPATRGHGLVLSDDSGQYFVEPRRWHRLDAQHPAMLSLFSSNGIGFGDPEFRYELVVAKPPFGANQIVRNLRVLVVHPVFDPDGQAPTIPPVGDPVAIVPGAEGPLAASAAALPLQPNATIQETPTINRERFDPIVAYVRTWSTWLRPRRVFRIEWGPVSAADRDAVLAVIAVGRFWQLTPPGGGGELIAVTSTEQPAVVQMSHRTWSVAVSCVELVYTV